MNIITRNHERYFYESLSWDSTFSYRSLYVLGDIRIYAITQVSKARPEKVPLTSCYVNIPRLNARMLFDLDLGTVSYTTYVPPYDAGALPDQPPVLGEIPNGHRDQLRETVLACLDTLDMYELPTGHMEMVRRTLDEYHHAR